MGGSIDVKSEPGHGSTFPVFFPGADGGEDAEVVLTTGNLTQGLKAEAAELGIGRILEKPYSMAELRNAVAALACGGNH